MATGFNGLDDAAPNDNGYIGDGAAEIRQVKNALITTFPAVDGEITKPADYGPVSGDAQPTADDFSQLFTDMAALVSPTTSNSPVVPQGTVTMWNGNTGDTALTSELNSKGWYLCTGGTAPNGFTIPNLQNMFVKGWGDQPVGASSGGASLGTLRTGDALVVGSNSQKSVSKTVTLTESNIPAHDHRMFASAAGGRNYVDNAYDGSLACDTGNGSLGGTSHIESDMRVAGVGGTPVVGSTSDWGNNSPSGIDIGLNSSDFNHEHEVTVSGDLEPSHYVIAFIIYAGVV